MSLPCCWPPSDTPPETPLSVDAGPDESVDTDTPLTLAGSAAGGTPAYTFAWTQLSGPGTATFDDDTDPTTDVSFDVAGEYVLQLTATDSVGSVAGDVVTETVSVAEVFLLDTLAVQPLWAHSLGVQLRTGQVNLFRVRRNQDDAELDITVDDLGDINAALNAFCASGLGYLVKVYNAVASSPYPEISAPSNAAQALVYAADDGGAYFGSTGFLAAKFDGTTPDPNTGINQYERADLLGLSGDASVFILGDLNTANADATQSIGYVGESDQPGFPSFTVDAFGFGSFYLGSTVAGANYTEVDYGSQTFSYSVPLPDVAAFSGWIQDSRLPGDGVENAIMRVNGVAQASAAAGNPGVPLALTLGVKSRFSWGASFYGVASGTGLIPPIGLASNYFCGAVPTPGDQLLYDAWQIAFHA